MYQTVIRYFFIVHCVSLPFCVISLLAYIFSVKTKGFHRQFLMSYVFSLAVMYFSLSAKELQTTHGINYHFFFDCLLHYGEMSCFLCLMAMNFDVWRNLNKINKMYLRISQQKEIEEHIEEKNIFWSYFMICFVVPFVVSLMIYDNHKNIYFETLSILMILWSGFYFISTRIKISRTKKILDQQRTFKNFKSSTNQKCFEMLKAR